MATLSVVTQDLHSTPRRARPPTPTGVAVRLVAGAVGGFVAAVFDMAEISDIIGRNVIRNADQDSLRNLYNLRCSMHATRNTGKEVVERIELYLSLEPVLESEINGNMCRVKRSLMTLIQQKQWVRMIINCCARHSVLQYSQSGSYAIVTRSYGWHDSLLLPQGRITATASPVLFASINRVYLCLLWLVYT